MSNQQKQVANGLDKRKAYFLARVGKTGRVAKKSIDVASVRKQRQDDIAIRDELIANSNDVQMYRDIVNAINLANRQLSEAGEAVSNDTK